MDTPTEQPQPASLADQPLTKWQALRERWALVKAKLATWWASHRDVAFWLAASAAIAIAALTLATCHSKPGIEQQQQQPVNDAAEQAEAIAELQAKVDYLLAIAAAPQSPSKTTAAPPTRATAWTKPTPQAQPKAAPAATQQPPAVWGTTDFDREIDAFSESIIQESTQ